MRVVWILLVGVALLAVSPALVVLAFEFHVAEQVVDSALALLMIMSVMTSLVMGVRGRWLRSVAGRPSGLDQLPAETTFAMFVLPLTTSFSGVLLTIGITIVTLAPGGPLLSSGHVIGAELAFGAIAVSAAMPFAAQRRVADERTGVRAPLFDPHAKRDAVERTLHERWKALVSRKRPWLSRERIAALGGLDSEPLVSWPRTASNRHSSMWTSALNIGLKASLGTLAASLAMVGYVVASEELHWNRAPEVPAPIQLAALILMFGLVPAIAMWTYAYAVLQEEQGEAEVLRHAKVLLLKRPADEALQAEIGSDSSRRSPDRIDRTPLDGYTRWSLIREAFRRGKRPVV